MQGNQVEGGLHDIVRGAHFFFQGGRAVVPGAEILTRHQPVCLVVDDEVPLLAALTPLPEYQVEATRQVAAEPGGQGRPRQHRRVTGQRPAGREVPGKQRRYLGGSHFAHWFIAAYQGQLEPELVQPVSTSDAGQADAAGKVPHRRQDGRVQTSTQHSASTGLPG